MLKFSTLNPLKSSQNTTWHRNMLKQYHLGR